MNISLIVLIMRQVKEREVLTLHGILLGESISEIANRLGRSEKTVNDYRRHLMSFFEAENMLDLARKAFLYGYCDHFIKDTTLLSQGREFTPFEVNHIEVVTLLHDMIRGYSFQELAVKYNLTLDNIMKQYVIICRHLDIKREQELFINTLASGYIRFVPFEFQEFDKEKLAAILDEWREGNNALKIPKYKIEFEFFIDD